MNFLSLLKELFPNLGQFYNHVLVRSNVANWILIGCGIAGMVGTWLFSYIINSNILEPLETPDSEQWSKVYILLMGFGSLGLFLTGIFKKH